MGAGSPVPAGREGMRHPTRLYFSLDPYRQLHYTLNMKQTMLLKLVPTPEQGAALLDTRHAVNAACDYAGAIACTTKTSNTFEVQKVVDGPLRVQYSLPAQLVSAACHPGDAQNGRSRQA